MFQNSLLKLSLAFALACSVWSPAGSATHAIVIGVDEYTDQRRLFGAVNDAVDIAGALERFGARVELFRNQEADRRSIEETWRRTLERARPGDTIVFTFAGHGGQEPDVDGDEANPLSPDDMHDETLLFSTHSANNPRERLLDDELYAWFSDAVTRGIRVVFVADSCYSGGVTRGGRTRRADPYAIPDTEIERLRARPRNPVPESKLPNFLFIAGSREAELVPEIQIDRLMRGAMSYAFARALEPDTSADHNDDGILTRDELAEYIPNLSQQMSDQHLPDLVPSGGADFPVLVRGDRVTNLTQQGTARVPPPPRDGVALDSPAGDLRWDPKFGDITNSTGDKVAIGVRKRQLAEIEAKFRAVDLVRKLAIGQPIRTQLLVDGRASSAVQHIGTNVALEALRLPYPWLTVFNLANNGEVQTLVPDPEAPGLEGPHVPGTRFLDDALKVHGPTGADHVIVLSTRDRPEALWDALERGDSAAKIARYLTALQNKPGIAAGLIQLYTR